MSAPNKNNNILYFGVGLGAAAAAFIAYTKLSGQSSTRELNPRNAKQWTVADVTQWLRRAGVSQQSCNVLADNEVDGSVLPLLEMHQLVDMGLHKLGDRLKILAATKSLGGLEEASTASDEAEAPQRNEAQQNRVLQLMTKRLNDVFRRVSSKEFAEASIDQQRTIIDSTIQELESLKEACAHLDEAHSNQLLPMITRALTMVADVQKAAAKATSAATGGARPPQQSAGAGDGAFTGLVMRLKQSHETLKQLPQLPPDERMSQLQTVARDVNTVTTQAQSLPEQERAQILPLARALLEIIVEVSEGAQAEVAPNASSPPAQEGGKSRDFNVFVAKLREMFEFFKGDALDEMTGAQQRTALGKRLEEISVIMNHIPKLPASEQQAILPLASSVQDIVKKYMEIVTKNTEGSSQGAAVQTAPAPDASVPLSEPAQLIVQHIRKIYVALQSPQLQEASEHDRGNLVRAMLSSVTDLRKHLDICAEDERSMIAPEIEELVSVLQGIPGKEDPLVEVIGRIRRIYDALQSPEFQQLAAREMMAAARTFLIEAQDIMAMASRLPGEQQQTVGPLLNQLITMLQSIVRSTVPHAQQPNGNGNGNGHAAADEDEEYEEAEENEEAPEEDEEEEEEGGDGSNQAARIVQHVQALFDFLNSDKFVKAPPEVQVDMAVQLQRDVEALEAKCKELPHAERETLSPLVSSLNDMILKFMGLNTPVTPGVSTFSGGHRSPSKASQGSPQKASASTSPQKATSPQTRSPSKQ